MSGALKNYCQQSSAHKSSTRSRETTAEHNRGLFIIKSGRMQVYKLSLRGRQLTLVMLYTGSVLIGRWMWGLHLQAMEPSIVCFVRRTDLERLIRKRPEVGLRLIDQLADELHLMDELLYDVIQRTLPPAWRASFCGC